MSLVLINLVILAFIAAGTWWLTGKDLAWSGESKRAHHLTRALRCVAVVFLSLIFLYVLEGPLSPADIPLLIICPVGGALLLRSALSEIFAHGFMRFLDPQMHDHREFDPRQSQRHMDEIARLIQAGRREEAIKLCEALRESGEVTDLLALEHTLEFLGAKQAEGRRLSPLNLAASLRNEGKLPAAETLLLSLLKQKPTDEGPALLLMRLYAEDLRQPERAYALLKEFARQPHVSSAHVDYARHSIPEWAISGRNAASQPAAPIELASVGRAAAEPTGSAKPAPFDLAAVDQLLAAGSLGSAVELLEGQIKTQPTDWKLKLKLAEIYAVHCHDVVRAQKIIGRLEQNAAFTADHVAMVRAKLEEWQAGTKQHP